MTRGYLCSLLVTWAAWAGGCGVGASPRAFLATDGEPLSDATSDATSEPGDYPTYPGDPSTDTGADATDTGDAAGDSASIPDSAPEGTDATDETDSPDTDSCGPLEVFGNGIDDDCDGLTDEDEDEPGDTGSGSSDPIDTEVPGTDTGAPGSDTGQATDTGSGSGDPGDTGDPASDSGDLPSDTGDPATDTGPCEGVYTDEAGQAWTYAGLGLLQDLMDNDPCAPLATCGGGWRLPTWEDVTAAAVPQAPGTEWHCFWTFLPPETPEAWPWIAMPAKGATYFLEWGERIYNTARCNYGHPAWARVGGTVEVQAWCVR